jgi:hypothetical protein
MEFTDEMMRFPFTGTVNRQGCPADPLHLDDPVFAEASIPATNTVNPQCCPADPLHLDELVVVEGGSDPEDDESCESESPASDRPVSSPYVRADLDLNTVEKAVADLEKKLEVARLCLRQCYLMESEMNAVYQRAHRSIASMCATRAERVQELTRILRDDAPRRARLDEDIVDAKRAVDEIADRLSISRLARDRLHILVTISKLSE